MGGLAVTALQEAPEGLGRGVVGLALVVVPLLVLPETMQFSGPKVGALLLLTAALALASPVRTGSGVSSLLASPLGLAWLGLAGYLGWQELSAAALPTAESSLAAWSAALPGQALALALPLVLVGWARTLPEDRLDTLVVVLAGPLCLALGGVALAQLSPPPGWGWLTFALPEQPVSTLGNRNHLAYALALLIPDAFAGTRRKEAAAKVAGGLGGLVGLAALGFTMCRGAYLALAVHVAARLALPATPSGAGKLRWRGAFLALLALLSPLVMVGVVEHLGDETATAKLQTLHVRAQTWDWMLEPLVEGMPLGRGAGAFAVEFPARKRSAFLALEGEAFVHAARGARLMPRPHNEWLHLAYDQGAVGLGLALAVLGLLLRGFLGALHRTARPGARARRRAGVAVLLGGLVAAGFHFPFREPVTALLLALAAARALGPQVRDGPVLLGMLAALPLALGAGLVGARTLVGELALGRAAHRLQGGALDEAGEAVAQAERVGFDPARVAAAKARLLAARGDARGAADAFDRAAELEPAWSRWLAAGIATGRAGDLGGALERFERAFLQLPTQTTAFHRASLLARMQRDAEADEVYRQGLRLPGFDPRLAYAHANRRWKAGDRLGALEALEEMEDTAARFVPPDAELARWVRLRVKGLRLQAQILEAAGRPEHAAHRISKVRAILGTDDGAGSDDEGPAEGDG